MRIGRRLVAVAGLVTAMLAAASVVLAPAASAHPLGNFTVNRYSGLVLSPGGVDLTYVLDMAEIPTFQEMPAVDTNRDGAASDGERQAWAERTAPEVLARLRLSANGDPVPLTVVSATMAFRPGQGGLPILRFTAAFAGSLPVSGQVRYVDGNFADRIGWKEVTVASGGGVAIEDSTVPAASVSHMLLAYPVDMLASPLDVRQASFSFGPGPAAGAPQGALGGRTVSGAPVSSGASFARLITWRLTPFVLALSLILAFGFGALHALGPGHGKTVTAAYLVGTGARVRQAVAAGLAVSFMHTASVLALGAMALVLFRTLPAERVYPWLGLITGVMALALGIGLLVMRVRARRRGTDWHGHAHAHPHEHEHVRGGHEAAGEGDRPNPSPTTSRKGLAALAISGGILPSPTALVVLTGAIASHRLVYGLGLIVGFSLGLATALILVALVAMRARSAVSRRLGSRVAGVVPVLSALVIVGFGAFFAARGILQVA